MFHCVVRGSTVALLVAVLLCCVMSGPRTSPRDGPPGPDQAQIEAFLETFVADAAKTGWTRHERHLSGADVSGVEYSVHRYIEVYSDPKADDWIARSKPSDGPADGAALIALVYDSQTGGKLLAANTMVRHHPPDGPADGWFWSRTQFTDGRTIDKTASRGDFGRSDCFACHGSAGNDGLVFLGGPGAQPDPAGWKPDDDLKWPTGQVKQPSSRRKQPLAAADPGFLAYYDVPDVPRAIPFPPKDLDHVWAGNYAGPAGTAKEQFVTSDQCAGCHNAAQLLSNSSPDMWYADPDPDLNLLPHAAKADEDVRRNYSPFGEWSASINALSGRDPVWHAQVDFERRLRPELADFTTSTCFSCHGAMATRQLQTDVDDPFAFFTIDMFYATGSDQHAKYGALARDGVSCAVCHQIGPKGLGDDPDFERWMPKVEPVGPLRPSGFFLPKIEDLNSYTALFKVEEGPKASYWGPYGDETISSSPMDRVLGQAAHSSTFVSDTNYIRESKLCGSCHTVLVPALPVGYRLPAGIKDPFLDRVKMAFEQTTYFEWRNSAYENEVDTHNPLATTCQDCHMTAHSRSNRIVNAESDRFPPVQGRRKGENDFKAHTPYGRHVLLGINYFVFEMYEQFAELLGTSVPDPRVPSATVDPTVNARDWVEHHAAVSTALTRITSATEVDGNLEVTVQVTNMAGHKFPTGAGFRRAFLDFEVLDANGKALWWSGRPNELGVIVGADGKPLRSEESIVPRESQPHHTVITRQDQVQIYETRALDSLQNLQTTVLGIYYEYKDNRIPPAGFAPPMDTDKPTRQATAAVLVGPSNLTEEEKKQYADQGYGDAAEHATVLDDGTRPYTVTYDPDYWDPDRAKLGQDNITYRVPLASIPNWAKVRAQLYYQTIPPYYLRDRFQTALPADERFPKERDMNRLIHVASRLDLAHTPAESWSLRIGQPAEVGPGEVQQPITAEDVRAHVQKHYGTGKPK